MIIESLAGAAAGLLGVVPFVHVNLLLQAFGPFFESETSLAAFAVSIAVSHSIAGLLPALVFIAGMRGNANGESGAEMRGMLGIAFISIAASIALLPAFALMLPILKERMRLELGLLFPAIMAAHFLSVKGARERIMGLAIFIAAGALGSITFFRGAVAEPLFPLLSGLYAIPALLLGVGELEIENGQGGGQNNNWGSRERDALATIAFAASISAFSTLFPALTPAVLMGTAGFVLGEGRQLSVAFPAIIVSKAFLDVAGSAITGNARSLAAVLALPLSQNGGSAGLIFIAAAGLAAAGFVCLSALLLSEKLRRFGGALGGEDARKAILAGILLLIFASGGSAALVIAGTAASLGILAHRMQVRRSNLMGALVLPAMLFMFGLEAVAEELLFG